MHVNAQPALRARLSDRPGARGIALITAVIMLLVITLLALAGARIAIDTKRSSRNQRDFEIAYQAAEAALYDAEIDIKSAAAPQSRSSLFAKDSLTGFEGGACNTGTKMPSAYLGLCDTFSAAGAPIWDTIDWTATSDNRTVEYGTFTGRTFPTGSGLSPSRKPRYLIELVSYKASGEAVNASYMYRVTAMGFGPNDSTRAVLQMVYRKEDAADAAH